MTDGDYEWISFIDQDGVGVKARLLETDVSNAGTPIQHTVDPPWSVVRPDGTNPQVQMLCVRATDGTKRGLSTDASWYGPNGSEPIPFHPYIAIQFHISNPLPDVSDARVDREFWFIDPADGQPYRVTINNVGKIPGRPTFHVSH